MTDMQDSPISFDVSKRIMNEQKPENGLIKYNANVNGATIKELFLPQMSQSERDLVRREIAKEHSIPSHYVRLKRVTYRTA